MSIQNIYDNTDFFDGYFALRKEENNFNILLEQPSMMEFLPDVSGKRVLDLGCGFGGNCIDFIRKGADSVVGIDVSEKMLTIAKNENSHPKIQYINMSMTEIDSLGKDFDLVYSSLAFHYIENFGELIAKIYDRLKDNGILLFSQEHPFTTATFDGKGHFNKDENEIHVSYTFSNYCQSGKRISSWFVDGVEKYHRTFGEVLTTIADAGFVIEKVVEPTPNDNALMLRPSMKKEFHKPSFLIIKAKK